MTQYPKIESTGSIGSIILAILEVQVLVYLVPGPKEVPISLGLRITYGAIQVPGPLGSVDPSVSEASTIEYPSPGLC